MLQRQPGMAVRLIAAATAAFTILVNALFWCRWRGAQGSQLQAVNGRSKRYKKNPSRPATPEQEALLQNEQESAGASGVGGEDALASGAQPAQLSCRGAKRAPPSPQEMHKELAEVLQARDDARGARDAFPDLGSPTDHRLSKRPRAGDTADPVPVDALKLQQLLGSQLGPPQFAVPKPSGHAATASLEALLEQEMGPPKFATLKEPSIIPQTVPNLALAPEPALLEHSAFPEPTAHLRLEVLNGPEAGKVFDTLDSASEVHIGRLVECSLPLGNDPEVSSRHALIQFSLVDHSWKLTDVGSLNGTLLNGASISANRQPSPAQTLSDGDTLVFGSNTQVRVGCSPSQPRAPLSADGLSTHLRSTLCDPPARPSPSTSAPGPSLQGPPGPSQGGSVSAEPMPRMRGMPQHMLSMVGAPLAVHHNARLGVSLAVQQRLGADHRRTNTGCEDVAHWCIPWGGNHINGHAAEEQRSGAADQCMLVALFDGHQGVNAAQQARELVPQQLHAQLKHQGLILGRSPGQQAELLKTLFLDVDKLMATDEGCTATVVLLQRDQDGSCLVQSANVGDSSAVLIQLLPQQPPLHANGAPTQPRTNSNGAYPPAASGAEHIAPSARAASSPQLPGASPTAPTPDSEDRECQGEGTPSWGSGSSTSRGDSHTYPTLASSVAAGLGVAGFEGGADAGVLWLKLSEDHRISTSTKERTRLAQLGHQTVRTRLYGLNISRMLGDRFLKDEALGFIAEPYVSPAVRVPTQSQPEASQGNGHAQPAGTPASQVYSVAADTQPPSASGGAAMQGKAAAAAGSAKMGRTFLVVASDGLWDVVQEGRAAGLMAKAVAEEPDLSVAELAGLLMSQAITLRSKDDITVMILEL